MNQRKTGWSILIIAISISLVMCLKISHKPLSYRMGSNYIQKFSNPSTIRQISCQQTQPIIPQSPVYTFIQPVAITSCLPPRIIDPFTDKCICLSSTIYFPQKNQCLCPCNKPLWNGKQCVNCPFNMYYDKEQKQCYSCPEGFVHITGQGKAKCVEGY